MKCQKCGASLPQGHLYCEKCGTEYQIVPDFEPEIENSIAETLSDVGDSIIGKPRDEADGEEPLEEENEFDNNKDKRKSFYPICACLGMAVLLFLICYYFYTDSISYIAKKAEQAEGNKDYSLALEKYGQLRKKDPANGRWYVKEAGLELLFGNTQNALQLGYRAIEETENDEEAFSLVLQLLIEEKDYQEAYNVLQLCSYPNVLREYSSYNSEVGALSHEGGTYKEIIHIAIEEARNDIYYTLDGSTPDRSSLEYEGPITLGKGTHTLSFISYNEYGVAGKILRKEYIIDTTTPLAPLVYPESGNLDMAEMIEIEAEKGTKIYYTTDLSKPTTDSLLYEEPIPIPLGESRFTFVAVSEDGTMGEYTYRDYMMNLKTRVSLAEAENILMEKLISVGHILDLNGAIQDRYGVFRYFYKFPLQLEGRNYYVFEEHYLENLVNNPLGSYYVVDVMDGTVLPLTKDFSGRYFKGIF